MTHPDTTERIAAKADRVLARADRARRGMPAPQVLLSAPGIEYAHGDRAQRFEAASTAKMMTASLALQLVERSRLRLDSPITRLLPAEETAGLFVIDGVDHAGEVTLAHLLGHTSGAADFFEGRSSAPVPFPRVVVVEPDRLWAPRDLLDYSRRYQQPVGVPGERFLYSDTGYVLLGRVIEEAGDASLGTQLHEGIFSPLGMDDSCLLFHTMPGGAASVPDPADALGLAPIWLDRDELSRARSLSIDWAGGGVVSTLDDLVRFSRAWHDGMLVDEASRTLMADARHRFRPGIWYGAGLMQLRYAGLSPFLRGMPRTVGHLGVTGVHLFAEPARGIHLAMNFHSTREMMRSFRVHIALMRLALR